MEFENTLTNEKIKKDFDSQFDLVNYLIRQARDMIRTGRASRVDADSDNVAVNVVAEIKSGKDKLPFEDSEEIEIEIESKETFTVDDLELANS